LKLLAFFASYWLDFVAVIAVTTATWMLSNFLARKRTSVLMVVAHQLGFAFAGDDWIRGSRAPQLETPLFRRGRDRLFRNIMIGSRAGLEVSFFDYSFGRGRRSTHQTLATFSQDVWLPLFEIAPKNLIHKVGDTILQRDIHFESHPSFSSLFQLRSSEEQKVKALFTSGLLSYLESLDPKMKWHLEACGLTLVIYRRGKLVRPEKYAGFVEETTAIAKAFFMLSGLRTFRTY
jgi:hypothetical protein